MSLVEFGPRPDEKNSLGGWGPRPGDRQSGLLQHCHGYPCDHRGLHGYAGGERGRATNKGMSIAGIVMGGLSILG